MMIYLLQTVGCLWLEVCVNVWLMTGLMVSGTDTSANTLTFGIWYLLNNPQYLNKLQDELKNAIPYSEDLSKFSKGWVELEKLDYLVS